MRFAIVLFVALFAATAAMAGTISVTAVGSHVGQTATVEGVVSGVYTSRSGTTFIDMGGPYPNNLFAGVIFSENTAKVGDVSELTGKTVDLSGTIKLYKGKSEIILKAADQVKVH